VIAAVVAMALALGANKPDLELSTLGIMCRELVASTPYKLEIPVDLDTKPVVYHFEGKAEPMVRLKSLCKNLLLKCTIDEDAKKIVLSRTLAPSNKAGRMQDGLNRLSRYLAQFRGWSSEEIAQESDKLLKRGQELIDDPVALGKLYWEQRILHSSATPGQRFLEKALFSGLTSQTAAIFSKDCSSTNQLRCSPTAQELWDILESHRIKPEQDGGQAESWIDKQPIAVLRHSMPVSGEFSVSLILVTPNQEKYLDSISLPFDLSIPTVPDQDKSFNLALQPKKPYSVLCQSKKIQQGLESPTGEAPEQDINGLGGLAIELKCNYAGWLNTRFYGRGLLNMPISKVLEYTRFRFSMADGWLQIVDYTEPIPDYSGSWEPFVKLKACVEDAPLTQNELLKKLDQLSDKDLKDLDQLPLLFMGSCADEYGGITWGVRLLRAALRESKAQQKESSIDFDLPIAGLTDEAKKDALSFFKGEMVWQLYIPLMHPLNAPRLGRIHLHAKTTELEDGIQLEWGLSYPPGSVSLPNRSAPKFMMVLAK
jgi:hypothetical protein